MRICEIAQVTRGYNCPKDNLTTDSNKGTEIYPLNFSDVDSDEIHVPEKKYFIHSKTAEKYEISVFDVILPATYTANILAKYIAKPVEKMYENKKEFKHFVYSQNIVLISLYKPKEEDDFMYYKPNELATLLNTEKMQQKLKDDVYTKTKGILIDNLRQLEIPYPTPELKQKLEEVKEKTNELEKCRKELEEKIQELNNLI